VRRVEKPEKDLREKEKEVKSRFRFMIISLAMSFMALIVSIIVFLSMQK
jgi:hypothetical protein